MGSSRVDGAPSPLSQPDQDAGGLRQGGGAGGATAAAGASDRPPPTDPLEDSGAAKPRAAPLERHLLRAEKPPHSVGSGPFFYIGGTNGVAM